jgi:hypothetical protein
MRLAALLATFERQSPGVDVAVREGAPEALAALGHISGVDRGFAVSPQVSFGVIQVVLVTRQLFPGLSLPGSSLRFLARAIVHGAAVVAAAPPGHRRPPASAGVRRDSEIPLEAA